MSDQVTDQVKEHKCVYGEMPPVSFKGTKDQRIEALKNFSNKIADAVMHSPGCFIKYEHMPVKDKYGHQMIDENGKLKQFTRRVIYVDKSIPDVFAKMHKDLKICKFFDNHKEIFKKFDNITSVLDPKITNAIGTAYDKELGEKLYAENQAKIAAFRDANHEKVREAGQSVDLSAELGVEKKPEVQSQSQEQSYSLSR